jgi:hypothetical protein
MDKLWSIVFSISGLCSIISFIIVAWCWKRFSKELNRDPNANSIYPSIMSGQGTAFTFLGVVWVLYNFDAANMSESIPAMLEGLKFAFVTSVFGLCGSLLAKLKANKVRHNYKSNEIDISKDEDDLYNALNNIGNYQEKMCDLLLRINSKGDSQNAHLSQLYENQSECNSLLLTSLAAIKNEISNSNTIMKKTLSNMSKEMMDSNMKILCANLKNIVDDFNEKMSSQLGENFITFNDAMGKVIQYQQQHQEALQLATQSFLNLKETVIEHNKEILKLRKHISSLQTTVDTVVNSTTDMQKTFIDNTKKLQENLNMNFEGTNQVIQKVNDVQKGFLDNLKALTSFNEESLNKNIALSDALKSVNESLNNLTDTEHDFTARRKQIFDDMQKTVDYSRASVEGLNKFNAKFEEKLQTIDVKLAEAINNMALKATDNINKIVKAYQISIEKQSTTLNSELENYINKSLESMADTMAKMNSDFIGDYKTIRSEYAKINTEIAALKPSPVTVISNSDKTTLDTSSDNVNKEQ